MFNLRAGLVSILCLAAASLGSYYLYRDLNRSDASGVGPAIGIVEYREFKVRRKSGTSFVWNNILEKENLYRKDSIQTGKGSAASLRLSNGNLLDIQEDSLVVMDDTTRLSVNFLRGSVVVHGQDGDSQVSVGKDGKTQVQDFSVRLLSPASLENFYVFSNTQKLLKFTWESREQNPPDSVQLEISPNRKFNSHSTQVFRSENPALAQVSLKLSSGTYFWRVANAGKDAVKPLTEVRQFRINSVSPLIPIFPEKEQKIAAILDPPAAGGIARGSVAFRWVLPRGMSSGTEAEVTRGQHWLEISRDPGFQKDNLSTPISALNGSAVVSIAQTGRHYWRMRSLFKSTDKTDGRGLEFWSPVVAFDLQFKTPVVAPAPTPTPSENPKLPFPMIVQPTDGMSFTLLNSKVPLEALWTAVKGADEYEVYIYSEDPSEGASRSGSRTKNVVLHSVTDQLRLNLKALKVGVYSWSIRSVDRNKRSGDFRPPVKFEVTYGDLLPAPEIVSPEVQ